MPSSPDPYRPSDFVAEPTLPGDAADAVVRILDEYLAAIRAGQAPQRSDLLARHPELATQLEACLAGLEFIQRAEHGERPAQRLGDFRIVREVGRGGMGAVFEAQQISLDRRVALKILRFGGVSDRQAIERFQREAETVAKLHHTNIVPIFAVGSEQGVNYYAMQFIEGQSLAQILAERPDSITVSQVAEWGQQAADALAHAHQRGVVHRDVKPSNLILDHEGRVWLTDFGLARRDDDVTLSRTGMLLGTPRYMSPEQATASTRRVDHRSDLFSLGATLYELLTNQPAFSGNTPHDVIEQILHNEPPPITERRPGVPRDLETIVMKCLAKDPTARYASAAELASDLRAFQEGHPIRARRQSVLERTVRWAKKKERNLRHASLAAVTTLTLTLLVLLLGRFYQAAQQASIRLDTNQAPLVAEFIDTQQKVVRTETLPMQNAAELPAGDYRLRVSGDRTLSQTYDLHLDKGFRNIQRSVQLQDPWLLSPRSIERIYDTVPQDGQSGILEWTAEGVKVHRTKGNEPTWSLAFDKDSKPLHDSPGFIWPWPRADGIDGSGYGDAANHPWVVQQPVDLNADGHRDILIAARHQAWLMALSGDGNGILWFAPRSTWLSSDAHQQTDRYGDAHRQSANVRRPLLVDDLDGDQFSDLIVTMVDLLGDTTIQRNQFPCRRWIEAISGRSGTTIWRYDLADELFVLADTEDVPYGLRWFPNLRGGHTSSGGGTMQFGRHAFRHPNVWERTGVHVYLPDSPHLLASNGTRRLAVIAGSQLILLDPASGRPTESTRSLDARPVRPVQWVDVDGDQSDDVIYLSKLPDTGGTSANFPTPIVHAWSSARNKQLWQQTLNAAWLTPANWYSAPPAWPLVKDLDRDGKAEIMVPWKRSQLAQMFQGVGGAYVQETPWCSLAVLAGDTGQPRWERRLVSMDLQIDQFDAGPDVDHDGVHDVVTATLAGPGEVLYVDCLSGATGYTLWSCHHALSDSHSSRAAQIGRIDWWRKPDGQTELLVQHISGDQSTRSSQWLTVSAQHGTIQHQVKRVTDLTPTDIDQDGIEDLIAYAPHSESDRDRGGQLHVIRGNSPTLWQRLGTVGRPVVDVDGDGVRDLLESWGDGTLVCTSGITGHRLWKSRPVPAVDQLLPRHSASDRDLSLRTSQHIDTDLNGDGTLDLLVAERSTGGRGRVTPLHAISGRDGALIWSLSDAAVQQISGSLSLLTTDLEGDQQPDVVWLSAVDHNYPTRQWFGSHAVQLWMFVADGVTGHLKWSQPLSPAYGQQAGKTSPYWLHDAHVELELADVNGDGVLDILAPAIGEDDRLELQALSGRDGQRLWRRARPDDRLSQQSLTNWVAPTACDFEQDGQPELILVEPSSIPAESSAGQRPTVAIYAVRGSDGRSIYEVQTGVEYAHFKTHVHDGAERLRPVVLRHGDRRRAAVFVPGTIGKLVSLNEHGAVDERAVRDALVLPGIRACDFNQDGIDELAMIAEDRIQIVDAEQLASPAWSSHLLNVSSCRWLQVSHSHGLLLAAPNGLQNDLLSFDLLSGSLKWHCPGPRPMDGDTHLLLEQFSVLGFQSSGNPLIFTTTGQFASCHRSVAADSAMYGTEQIEKPLIAARAVGANRDPRWQRDLPWRRDFSLTPVWQFFLWAAFFGVTLVVVPIGYFAWLLHRRCYTLRRWLFLPAVAGIVLVATQIPAPFDNDFSTPLRRLLIGLAASPPLVALGMLGVWMMRRQWGRVIGWLVGILGIGILIGAISVSHYLKGAPLLPEESFDWTGWYLILAPAAYTVSCLVVGLTTLGWIGGVIVRYLRPTSPILQPSGPATPAATIALTEVADHERKANR